MSSRIAAAVGVLAVTTAATAVGRGNASPPAKQRFAVGLTVLRLDDPTRSIRLPNGHREPRPLVTYVRYPAVGSPSAADLPGRRPARAAAPYPLIVFGHGYRVTPAVYGRLLRDWASTGYVVAAPVFPLENAYAPGGPDENDIVNQPADVRFVITRLLAAGRSPASPLEGMIDPTRIAVSGHSDGGETALAVAYAPGYRDPRVRAAVILSGAKMPGSRLTFPRPSPPLLATQGTADSLNLPEDTQAFFDAAPRPKFLLTLHGARHLAPYTSDRPQLRIVERTTLAFLDHVLKRAPLEPLLAAGNVEGAATLTADP
jgi:dienelactone hydrolase